MPAVVPVVMPVMTTVAVAATAKLNAPATVGLDRTLTGCSRWFTLTGR